MMSYIMSYMFSYIFSYILSYILEFLSPDSKWLWSFMMHDETWEEAEFSTLLPRSVCVGSGTDLPSHHELLSRVFIRWKATTKLKPFQSYSKLKTMIATFV